jgi:hypothetical protein
LLSGSAFEGEIVRDGDELRVPVLRAVLPDRCVRCNRPGCDPRLKQFLNRFSTVGPFWTTLVVVFASWMALFWLRPVIVEFSMCAAHLRSRRRSMLLCFAASAACFVLGWFAFVRDAPGAGLIAFGACATWGLLMRRAANVIVLRKRDDEYAWLKVPAPFLDGIGEAK